MRAKVVDVISASHFIQFFVASILILLVPGPSVLFTLARGVAWGRAVAVLTVATTPAITSQSPAADLTLVVGQTVTLTVSALGANPETFNWYSNSVLVATTRGRLLPAVAGL